MLSIDNITTMTVAEPANEDFVVRQRLDAFKLGKSFSTAAPGAPRPAHRHQRSHSRNTSISSSSSISHSSLASSRSSGLQDLPGFSFGGSISSSASTTSSLASSTSTSAPPPTTKRNSHHRRRSSVSTRHESAELMGVTLPELPPSSSDHNVNFGDKDSIRRRALWALEGKPDVAFTKVEIPELSTPDVEKMMFDFSSKSSFSGGSSASFGNSLMGNKRDSFKLLPPSGSSKDQLHTLVEEEEEDEEDEPVSRVETAEQLSSPISADKETVSAAEEPTQVAPLPSAALNKATLGKPRPATLNLRPLSLVAETLGTSAVQGLPTPSLSPSPRTGLRSLSLSPASSGDESSKENQPVNRSSFILNNARRPALNLKTASIDSSVSSGDESKPFRRSSISYRNSSINAAGLPTPEMTPTFTRRYSLAESNKGVEEEFFLGSHQQQSSCKPLSASEQQFLLKSHNALVARITDLERALSRRTSLGSYSSSSRPSSILSDSTSFSEKSNSPIPGEPSDEMLTFIRDLKAERDELKKDVEGWRTRVNDLDRKHALLAKRVETERWEAWAARSRVGILESEKAALEKRVEALDQSLADLEADKDNLKIRNRELQSQNEAKAKRVEELEAQLKQVKEELEKERLLHQQQVAAIRSANLDADLLATPTPQVFQPQPNSSLSPVNLGLGLVDDQPTFAFTLNAVPEGDEDSYSEEDNGLGRYEDEEDYDESYEASSSYGSSDEFSQRSGNPFIRKESPTSPLTPSYAQFDDVSIASPASLTFGRSQASPPPVPARPDALRDSELAFNWTFPRAQPAAKVESHQPKPSVDRFFNCLDESEDSDDSAPASPVSFNYEQSKDMFASGFRFAVQDDTPFFLPPGIGTVVEEHTAKLSTVAEEDEEDEYIEDDEDMFGEAGGIRITFTPPDEVEEPEEPPQIQVSSPVKAPSTPPVLPVLNFGSGDEEEEDFFSLPSTVSKEVETEGRPVAQPAAAQPEITLTSVGQPSAPPTPVTHSSATSCTSPKVTSPSSIPRPISRQSNKSQGSASSSPHSPPLAFSAFATPPTKRGGTTPSFIPQSVTSPSPVRTASSQKSKIAIAAPTFIRPPNRKPTVPTAPAAKPQGTSRNANGSTLTAKPATQHSILNSKWQPRLQHKART
ncbi:hypothetical protein CC2G_010374 [Coprinopsis cinerea AmutBmut pab1-1]|nr:hypothetical protein CC2G_010374 [Coprinopsis cinerea AmutBmut pab1-1]